MKISSTEFQQNVGHYLKLAQQGTEVIIERHKPTKYTFKLTGVPAQQPADELNVSQNAMLAKMKKIRSLRMRFTDNDCTDFVRRVRR